MSALAAKNNHHHETINKIIGRPCIRETWYDYLQLYQDRLNNNINTIIIIQHVKQEGHFVPTARGGQ